jgi:hypothetical protein
LLIHQRIVDGCSAKIYSRYDWHAVSPVLFGDCLVQRSRLFCGYLRKWRIGNTSRKDEQFS